ncbi:hypothetical protein PsYK624_096570 [Phanerochaete sordida]|uniref:Uncharacterized protein n=1 Tax=Phanerochaete sordida TaxID=48140 RepID=A0A9P3GCB7_9APHY|nr:hypothetical protein PsYK624_096570 [Phanerochaete sordida]
MRTPITFREDIFLHIKNYRLRAITDIAHFMRTLWESTGWQIQLTNVSWVKSPQAVPRTIGMRNRATCDNLDIRQCAERWPFVWLCISTRTPEPGSVTPVPYLTLDEAFRLGAFVRCLTVPAGLQGRPYCACTTIHRNGPLKHRSNNAFALQLNCVEKSWICMPWTRIACEGGHISEFMITFNTDPAIGCMPSDFDWDEFDELASHCHGLAQVVMRLDGDLAYVTHFAEDMGRRLRRLRATQRLVIFYEGTEDDDQAWHTWEWRD